MQNSSHQVQYQDRPYQFHLPLPILAHRLVYKDTRDHNHKYYIFFELKVLYFSFLVSSSHEHQKPAISSFAAAGDGKGWENADQSRSYHAT